MPFDGVIPQQRNQAPPPMEVKTLAGMDRRPVGRPPEVSAEAALDAVKKRLATALDVAATSQALNEDQRTLLQHLRSDPRLARLDEVVYADPATGRSHTMREYFSGDQPGVGQTFEYVEGVLKDYQAAQKRWWDEREAMEARQAAVFAADAAKRAEWQEQAAPPGVEAAAAAIRDGRGFRERGYDARVAQNQEVWRQMNERMAGHLQRIKEGLDKPFVLPILPGQPGYEEQRAASRQEQQPATRVLWADAMPRAEAPVPRPDAIVGPNEPTMIMQAMPAVEPAKPKKPSLGAAIGGFFRKVFG